MRHHEIMLPNALKPRYSKAALQSFKSKVLKNIFDKNLSNKLWFTNKCSFQVLFNKSRLLIIFKIVKFQIGKLLD